MRGVFLASYVNLLTLINRNEREGPALGPHRTFSYFFTDLTDVTKPIEMELGTHEEAWSARPSSPAKCSRDCPT